MYVEGGMDEGSKSAGEHNNWPVQTQQSTTAMQELFIIKIMQQLQQPKTNYPTNLVLNWKNKLILSNWTTISLINLS